MENPYFYGLTIGPIYKTISQVRATRELWGASYLFSHLMKQIVEGLNQMSGVEVLSPAGDVPSKGRQLGVGLFPDQCYFKASKQVGDDIIKMIVQIKQQLAVAVSDDLKKEKWFPAGDLKDKVHEFFEAYLQTYLVRTPQEKDLIPTKKLQRLMENAELRPPFLMHAPDDGQYLRTFLHMINTSFLKREAYGPDRPDIDSLPEIGIKELLVSEDQECKSASQVIVQKWREDNAQLLREKRKEAEKNHTGERKKWSDILLRDMKPEKLLEQLADHDNISPLLKNYHKYIAVVYADGDNISKTIKKLPQETKAYQTLSEEMLAFGVDATQKILDYQGFPVYLGGDDLLFFAPIKVGERTIFHLVKELDQIFKEHISVKDTAFPPSQSFGISISYYKFPLYEALALGHDLMEGQAKKFPFSKDSDPLKNAIAFQFLKHSGHEIGQVIPMTAGTTFTPFMNLLDKQLDDSERLLSSVAYKMEKNAAILDEIGTKLPRLTNFFKESFNEEIHGKGAKKEYLEEVKQMVHSAYTDAETFFPKKTRQEQGTYARQTIYSLLRMLHFLTQEYYD